MTRFGGIVLCGGRSSRMGRPKAWLPVGDETMLQRVVRVVGEAVGPVVVVAAPGQDIPPLPAGVGLARDKAEGLGPLAGLVAGLGALDGQVEAVYLSACDVPFLYSEFIRRICERLGNSTACVPEVDGRRHPLSAAYRTSALEVAVRFLAAGNRRMTAFVEAIPTCFLGPADFADMDLLTLWNVNTPDEYSAALESSQRH